MSPQHEHEDEDAHLEEEDIVEVVEDDDEDQPMDEDNDNGEGYESDGDNAKYDGEIVIGAPVGAEEEAEYEEYQRQQARAEDNSWGASSLHASQQSVFALALHPSFPNPPLAISGGEDDAGFIFCPIPAESGDEFTADSFPAVKLTGHTDSVVSVGWSFDGEMVATGGMDGRVRVWRRVKGRKGSPAPGSGDLIGEWRNWEFLTSLETGSEVQVSPPR
jgi:ribosome assembly protein SQT1